MGADDEQAEWTSLVLLERFRGGDDLAAAEIFDRYFRRLTALARSRLSPRLAQRTDPEDIVLSVYRSFFVDARRGRYTLSRGGDLWRLLAAIARHKLSRQARSQGADRRSVALEIPLDQVDEGRFAGRQHDPTPEEAAALADELEWVLAQLDRFGRRVLELRLQGLKVSEIAADTGRAERSVRRSLARIRTLLAQRHLEAESAGPPLTTRPASESTPPEEQAELDPGVPLLSHRDFLLRRLIGAGRMGKVYEAWQHGAGREVAVKFLRRPLLQHPGVVRRFLDEARTVARLRHPHIVGTQGLGRTPGGSYFIVMDLVTGPNLAQIGAQREITVDEVIRWALETCLALEHAHERGIIHCDLKPANLLLDPSGMVRVTDFGLARSLAEDTPGAAEVEGTAPFMAPEQASRCWGPIDHRTDVYGIGAVIFTLLTGRPPIVGRRLPDVLAEVVSATPVVAPARLRPGLPEPLDALCRKCLAKPPGARFQTVQEVRSALVEVEARTAGS
jgi:RNA polymerase sigma factor (sigma-70 family)